MLGLDFKIGNEGVKAYIANIEPALQPRFLEFIKLFQSVLPHAEIVMKYGMPTFFEHKSLLFLAVWKHHIGIYPHAEAIQVFASELSAYTCSKGAIQIPHTAPIPEKLLIKIALFRQNEVGKQTQLVKRNEKKNA